MTRLLFLALLVVAGGCQTLFPTRASESSPAAGASAEGEKKGDSASKMKPFSEIVTDDAQTDDGMFTVHLEDDGQKLLFQIPDSLLNKEMLVVSRLARTTEGYQYGGAKVNTQAVRWERQGDFVLLRTVRYASVAADSLPIFRAVRDAQFEPIVARVPVVAIGPDSASVVVDMTGTFTGDTPVFGLPRGAREEFKVRRLDGDRSFLARAMSFPENVEIRSVLTYDSAEPPENASTGTLSVEMAHSMVLLPEGDDMMRPRRADDRVGYFSIEQTDYGLSAQRAETREYVTRWKLVPKDTAAYARGELVEPVEPIVYYIDPATPAEWREPLKQGVEDWNVAFEAAGFKNAIRAADAPENDPEWSPEDARYSVIRYYPSDIQNASGPHVHDPRTGQILESDINWYHNVMNLLRNWYFVQTAAVNPDARAPRFRQEVMGELVRFVSAHEVGHTLGLPHNWISSTAYPVDSLRSPTFTAAHGTAPSIMDYARFNYIAQPGDGVAQLMPRVGEYDKWAIKWGYTYFPDTTPDEERARLQAMTMATRGDLALRYGAQTFDPVDPRSQSEDLGDDAVYASQLGLANLKRIVPRLRDWTTEPGEDYSDLDELYGQVVGQWGRYLGHVARQVGGVEIDPKMVGEEGAVYQPVDARRQRAALRFLVEEGFTTPEWLLDTDVLGLIEPAGTSARIQRLQEGALDRLLDPVRLDRLAEAEWLAGGDAYPAAEMMDDLQDGLFSETARGGAIDPARRSLQRAYVDRLGELLTSDDLGIPAQFASRAYGYAPQDTDRSEVRPLARGALLTLQEDIARALPRYRADSRRAERYHLLDLQARTEDILDPDD